MAKARLTLVVEYEDLPSDADVEDLVDRARGDGEVVKADYEILVPVKRSYK
jgi:hypothetical protein